MKTMAGERTTTVMRRDPETLPALWRRARPAHVALPAVLSPALQGAVPGRGNEVGAVTLTYNCEHCDERLTRNEYVAVGPTTPAARQLGLVDRSRDHLVVCDDCFETAVEAIE